MADEAAAAAEARARGVCWAVGFACAVKSFGSRANAAMRGWLAEAGLAGRSAPADESMAPLLQRLHNSFGPMVCCASCNAKCVVLDFAGDFAGDFVEGTCDVCVCVCGALLCGYSCGMGACQCCGSRCRLYTSVTASRSQWSAVAWDDAQWSKVRSPSGAPRVCGELRVKLAALEHRIACTAAQSLLAEAPPDAVVGPLVVPVVPSGGERRQHLRSTPGALQYFLDDRTQLWTRSWQPQRIKHDYSTRPVYVPAPMHTLG